jgi:hypothetical protein
MKYRRWQRWTVFTVGAVLVCTGGVASVEGSDLTIPLNITGLALLVLAADESLWMKEVRGAVRNQEGARVSGQ